MSPEERFSIVRSFCANDAFLKNHILEWHACDPFAPVITVEEGVFCLPHLSPDRTAAANVFLVCGTERALLIDTAYGIGDLKALCGELTDLPVYLVNTHFHPDHTGGNTRFGSCYMHENDAAKPELMRKPPQISAIEKNPDNFYTIADVAAPGRGRVTPIKDSHTFDLGGGYVIEVIHLPGHTSGSIALLDRKRGILFTGDAVMQSPCSTLIVSFAGTSGDGEATVEAFRDSLLRLEKHLGEIKLLCPSHCAPTASPALITDVLACCEDIISRPGIGVSSLFAPGARLHSHGKTSITYSQNHICRKRPLP